MTGPAGDEAALFHEYGHRLPAIVGSVVDAPDATIEDACQFAWIQLLRTQPERRPTLRRPRLANRGVGP